MTGYHFLRGVEKEGKRDNSFVKTMGDLIWKVLHSLKRCGVFLTALQCGAREKIEKLGAFEGWENRIPSSIR